MRVFNCQSCGHLVFFDSLQCLHCGAALAFVPGQLDIRAMEPAQAPAAPGLWQIGETFHSGGSRPLYKPCAHREGLSLCNFAVAADDACDLCVSCRQTSWLPDAANPANQLRWARIEATKRRLFYTLSRLGLGPRPGQREPSYALLADLPGQMPVMTGHASGTITLNVIEADDGERALRRLALKEPFRTLAGHLRHEVGHFFWEQLIAHGRWLEPFRALFGDERQDYGQALQAYYARDMLDASWQNDYISAYATAHPWEDWAETWAHYLHMVDLLETAASYGTRLALPALFGAEHAALPDERIEDPFATPAPSFERMLSQWGPLTLLVNSLNSSLGHGDAYPFAISWGVRRKLEFVHQVVSEQRGRAPAQSP